ncbi:hypothetical protein Bca52824_085366 [Brassica carinata]|uniref:Uncharacterized protein n=1 Tax=Brassica carinata TaxID=52824 RepID=A0A8X7P817_BRACI|nr:hypothetical protein Bca52824_085366 [Brassica carinata]
MDPRIPYSQSTGYMGLLHSQQGSICPENSPYETFPSVSQQFPQFSSQESEAPTPPTEIPRKTGVSDSQPTTPNVGGEEIRPEGVKAAKSNRSAMGKGKSVADCTARKEKLSKLAILDTLLARSGPLSEAEEVAKNKLLAEYF